MAKDGVSQFMVNDSPFMDAVDDVVEKLQATKQEEPDEIDGEDDEERSDSGDGVEDDSGDDGAGQGGDGEGDSEGDSEESDSSEDEEDDDSEEESEEEGKQKVEPASYTATLASGAQVKLADDTTLKLKVDGKFQRVSVKDLTSEYNGRIKYDEQIRRNAEETKILKSQNATLKNQADRAVNLTKAFMAGITKGDLIEAMSLVAEMTNSQEDPEKTLQDALAGIGKAIDELSALSPEEVRRRAQDYKLSVETKRREEKLSEYDRQERIREAKLEKERLKEEYSLTEEEMKASYDALEGRNQSLRSEGKQAIDFSLDDVATLAVEFKHYSAINEVVSDHKLELKDGDVNYLVSLAMLKAQNEGRSLKKKDYVQLLSNHVNKELQSLSRKVGSEKTTPKSKSKKNKPVAREIKRVSQIWD